VLSGDLNRKHGFCEAFVDLRTFRRSAGNLKLSARERGIAIEDRNDARERDAADVCSLFYSWLLMFLSLPPASRVTLGLHHRQLQVRTIVLPFGR
jgi:hypothetical protein